MESNNSVDKLSSSRSTNPFLLQIYQELIPLYFYDLKNHSNNTASSSTLQLDGYLLYILGVILQNLLNQGCSFNMDIFTEDDVKIPQEDYPTPITLLIEAVKLEPYNWSAWIEITKICVLENIDPPSWPLPGVFPTTSSTNSTTTSSNNNNNSHELINQYDSQCAQIMYQFFLAHYYIEIQLGDKAIPIINFLSQIFPRSNYLSLQVSGPFISYNNFHRMFFFYTYILIYIFFYSFLSFVFVYFCFVFFSFLFNLIN